MMRDERSRATVSEQSRIVTTRLATDLPLYEQLTWTASGLARTLSICTYASCLKVRQKEDAGETLG